MERFYESYIAPVEGADNELAAKLKKVDYYWRNI